jgi:uncharacterized membrane protein
VTSAQSNPDRQVFLDAVLHPHRSLPRRGFHLMMLGLCALSVAAGIGFVSVGAWPIVGFFGLDVALIYVALCLSYRAARQKELVRLTEKSLTVERVSIHGARRVFSFEPYWIRVLFHEDEDTNSLAVASHGRTLVLGSFLAPETRRNFAKQLADALCRWRAFIEGRDTR